MNYVLFGVNHKTAPLELREKLAFNDQKCQSFLQAVLASDTLKESAVLSTCNRVEIYGVTASPDQALAHIQKHLDHTLGATLLPAQSYSKTNDAVVTHLFSVVASLDSMVVGENQISGQVKDAFKLAQNNKATGPYLNQLFHRAFSVAKRVKTETQIGRGHVSLGSVAVMLTKKIFGETPDCRITLLGAGEMGQTVLAALQAESTNAQVTLINRTYERAAELMQAGLGVAKPFVDLWSQLTTTNILITSLAAGFEDLNEANFVKLMESRKNAPLFLIDLGVPRNIAPAVGDLPNVYLYNIDDLQKITAENQNIRLSEMDEAKIIIDEETKAFYESVSDHLTTPMIAKLNQKVEWIRQNELEKTLTRLKHLSDEDQKAIGLMTQALVKKILHDPILHLKTDATAKEPYVLQLVRKIFRLNDEEENI